MESDQKKVISNEKALSRKGMSRSSLNPEIPKGYTFIISDPKGEIKSE